MPSAYWSDGSRNVYNSLPRAFQALTGDLDYTDATLVFPLLRTFTEWQETMKFDLEPQYINAQDLRRMSQAAHHTIKLQETVQSLLLAYTSRARRFQDWVEIASDTHASQMTPRHRATDKFPNELLLHIFEFAVGLTGGGIDFWMRKDLMLCCEDWERLVKCNTAMWSHIRLKNPSKYYGYEEDGLIDYVKMTKERSGNLPLILDVVLGNDFGNHWSPQKDEEILSILRDLIPRGTNITLVVPNRILPLPSPPSSGKRLSISIIDAQSDNSSCLFVHDGDVVMPVLCPVSLNLNCLGATSFLLLPAIDLSRVTHFGLETNSASAAHLEEVLMALDSVQHMSLHLDARRSEAPSAESSGTTKSNPLVFAGLKSLSVTGDKAFSFAERFQMPALQAAQLIGHEYSHHPAEEDWITLVSACLSGCPLLQALTLVHFEHQIPALPLHQASRLKTLSLHASVDKHLKALDGDAASVIGSSSISNLHIGSPPYSVSKKDTRTILKLLRQVLKRKKNLQVYIYPSIHPEDSHPSRMSTDQKGLNYLSDLVRTIDRFQIMEKRSFCSATVKDLCAWVEQMDEASGEKTVDLASSEAHLRENNM